LDIFLDVSIFIEMKIEFLRYCSIFLSVLGEGETMTFYAAQADFLTQPPELRLQHIPSCPV
jgi:hypothetical protein